MSQLWRQSKSSFNLLTSLLVALTLAVTLSGCYGGWKGSKKDNDNDGSGKPGPTTKQAGLALLDVFYLSAEAMKDSNCSPVPKSLVELRQLEISQRTEAIKAVLSEMAEVVKLQLVPIAPEDCKSLSSIESMAYSLRDLGGVSKDLRKKPVLHVKLVIWSGDYAYAYPSAAVQSDSWAIMNQLLKEGYTRQLSITHFANSSRSYGYASNWRKWVNPQFRFDATTIESPAVDNSGVQKMKEAVEKSTLDFGIWLTERLSGV